MPKRTWIARTASAVSIVLIACIAGCGRQPPPPSAEAPADPAPVSSPPPADRAPASGSSAAPPGRPGAPPDELCDVAECGPPIRMPVRRCPDGSIGGPTGRCLRKPDGRCAWEVRPCPPG